LCVAFILAVETACRGVIRRAAIDTDKT